MNVVDPADIKAFLLIHFVGLGGEKDDGNVARRGNVLESPADLIAIHSGHRHIKQDEIRLLRAVGDGQRLLAIGGNLGPEESFSTPETTATLVGVSSTIKTSFLSGLDIIRLEVVYQTGNDMRIAFTTATRECERDTRASSTF